MPRVDWAQRFETGKLYTNVGKPIWVADKSGRSSSAPAGTVFIFLALTTPGAIARGGASVKLIFGDRVVITYQSAFRYLKRVNCEPGDKQS